MEREFGCLLAFVTLVGFGCATPPAGGIYYTTGEGSVTPEGLHRIEWEPFQATYVKPGAVFHQYAKVLVQDITVSYKTPPPERPHTLSNRRPVVANYALPDSAIESLKSDYRETFEHSLAKSESFVIADEPGPDVLLLTGRIVDLEVTVPQQRYQSPSEPYYSNSPGRMTLVLEAKDSRSGESLLMVGERRDIDMNDGGIYLADSVSNSAALQQAFARWADALRRELDYFHSLPALPPAPSF